MEAVREVFDAWGRGDFRTPDLFDAEIVFAMGPDFPDSGTYRGLDELGEYMRGFLEPWRRLTIEAEEIRASADKVFVRAHQRGTGGESGVATELRYFQVWWFEHGKVVRLENFRQRADALTAAGLVE